MKTRISTPTLLAALLLCAPLGAFAQTKPATTPPVVSTPPVATAPSVNVGQSVTISSTSYVVSAKKQLATGVEFYTMKPAATKATAPTFLRTNNTYNATVFTQAQFQAFITSGKASSFGTVRSMVIGKKPYKYVTKGSTIAVFAAGTTGSGMQMYEFQDDKVLALAPNGNNDDGGCTNSPLGEALCCRINCIDITKDYKECVKTCPPAAKPNASLHVLTSAKPVVM